MFTFLQMFYMADKINTIKLQLFQRDDWSRLVLVNQYLQQISKMHNHHKSNVGMSLQLSFIQGLFGVLDGTFI